MRPRNHRGLIVAAFAYVAALLSVPSPARAEDIDIFRVNPNLTTQRPNVLIILDTSANWASTDTVAGGSKYEHVRKALADTIEGPTGTGGIMQSGAFNVGLMMYAETGGGNSNIDGGVLRIGMRHLDPATNGPTIAAFFRTVDANFDKSNNTSMGLAFFEAHQYFLGGTPRSGNNKVKSDYTGNTLPTAGNQADNNPTLQYSNAVWNLPATAPLPRNALNAINSSSYNSPISDACQKNFIIYISNGNVTDPASADHTGSDSAKSRLDTLSGVTNNTNDIRITDPTKSPDAGTAEDNMSDEWAKWLYSNDIRSDLAGKQNIVTYTVEINAVADNQGRQNSVLLESTAVNGGGRYFPVTSAGGGTAIVDALNTIFAEILAVSSVFASVSLPASVNVRGTFLNQIYMGVFRPDAASSPRWPGNLKQYALGVINSGQPDEQVVLVDSRTPPQPVEDTSGATGVDKGLVAADTVSFWTTSSTFWNTTYYPDAKQKPPLAVTPSDSPDGQFVEKGGHAQRLRSTFLTSLDTRNVYTCVNCTSLPSNTDLSASPDPLNPAYEFRTSNGLLNDGLFGITSAKAVTSLNRSGTTVTAVVPAHGFTDQQAVTFDGATQGEYNVTNTITKIDNDTITYQITELPVSPATSTAAGSITAVKAGGGTASIGTITRSDTTATVNTTAAHPFLAGSTVTLSGTTGALYDGNFTIQSVAADQLSFTITVSTTPGTASLGGAKVTIAGVTKNISALTRTGQTVLVTASGILTGSSPNSGAITEIKSVSPTTYNCASGSCTFTYTRVGTSNDQFTYQLPASSIGPADQAAAAGTGTVSTASSTVTLTRGTSTGNLAVVTATTPANHSFVTNDLLTISGADQSHYNGTFTITKTANREFTYQITTGPTTPATTLGGITATGSGGISLASLINWVRGANVLGEDNPDLQATSVRGYLHGDVLHSRPVVINYNRDNPVTERDIVVYYGANDGMLHAVKGGQDPADGVEKWSFVPEEFYNRFSRLYTESPIMSTAAPRPYFVDGPVSANLVYAVDPSSPDPLNPIERLTEALGAKAQIFVGMRRGGRFYYALNVINPDAPRFMWKIDNTMTDFAELGQSWSEMKVAKIRLTTNCPATGAPGICRVLIFGGGYDAAANDPVTQGTATMGRAIFIVDAETGTLIWRAASTSAPNITTGVNVPVTGMDYAIPADVTVIDSNIDVDKLHDRVYATDTGGNIWRVNISDGDPANWTVGKIAALGGTGTNARKFLFGPDVVKLNATTDSVLVGSGDREQPFETAIANRFYMVKDDHDLTAAAPVTPIAEGDLCPLSVASPDASACLADPLKKGWVFELETGEKVVTGALTLAGVTVFSTNTPASQSAPGTCTGSLGRALTYAIKFDTATPGIDWNGDGNYDAFTTEETRGGFLSTAVQFTGTVDGKPVETFIVAPRVYTPSGPAVGQRYRVFWNLSVDN